MNYRLATVIGREAVSADKQRIISITLKDPVSQMQVVYESTGGASGPPVALAAACVTKVELVDGSDVLFSLDGYETQALDFYHSKKEPANMNVYLGGNNAEMVFNMNFGRFLWDTVLAFDPRRFENPQLRITIDVDAGGQASSAGFLTVLAHIFDEKEISPVGFLMHKEIKNYAIAGATHEYTDLPTDFPIRKLLIKALIPGTSMENVLNTIKLSEDNDKRIPFNHTIRDIIRAIVGQGRTYREKQLMALGGTTGYFFCTPTYWPMMNVTIWRGSQLDVTVNAYGGDGGRGNLYAAASVDNIILDIEGFLPHGVIEIPFGLQDEIDDWYDVTKLGSLKLDILGVSGITDNCQIFLQQVRMY